MSWSFWKRSAVNAFTITAEDWASYKDTARQIGNVTGGLFFLLIVVAVICNVIDGQPKRDDHELKVCEAMEAMDRAHLSDDCRRLMAEALVRANEEYEAAHKRP
jgi:Ca2+/Na+ antiporter